MDMAIGVGLALIVGVLIWRTSLLPWLVPLCLSAGVIAVVYVPLRVRPRRAALDEVRARQELIDPRCPQCAYPLRHLRQRRCPECGRRVTLPSAEQVRRVLDGERVAVAKGSIEAELGWIVALLMILAAMTIGRLFGPLAGWCAAAAPPLIFLVFMAAGRHRQALSVPPWAICDKCGESTSVHENQCTHCRAKLNAEHVYVKPGLRGGADPRLYCTWAQLIGGACVALMLVLNGLFASRPVRTDLQPMDHAFIPLQAGLMIAAVYWLLIDRRMVRPDRLDRFDTSPRPLCHHCLRSITGQPANGRCVHCGRAYRGIELAGGLRVIPEPSKRPEAPAAG
ncbi:MAG: hypothetical protein H6816_11225 [Phycisphaerales bacterium]|nr:hypothetical protein [Phycisphaerales bacterium]